MNTLVSMATMHLLLSVKNDKKSFAHYKVSILKDEIAHNDLSYERYLKELSHDISLMKSSILQQKALMMLHHFSMLVLSN